MSESLVLGLVAGLVGTLFAVAGFNFLRGALPLGAWSVSPSLCADRSIERALLSAKARRADTRAADGTYGCANRMITGLSCSLDSGPLAVPGRM